MNANIKKLKQLIDDIDGFEHNIHYYTYRGGSTISMEDKEVTLRDLNQYLDETYIELKQLCSIISQENKLK